VSSTSELVRAFPLLTFPTYENYGVKNGFDLSRTLDRSDNPLRTAMIRSVSGVTLWNFMPKWECRLISDEKMKKGVENLGMKPSGKPNVDRWIILKMTMDITFTQSAQDQVYHRVAEPDSAPNNSKTLYVHFVPTGKPKWQIIIKAMNLSCESIAVCLSDLYIIFWISIVTQWPDQLQVTGPPSAAGSNFSGVSSFPLVMTGCTYTDIYVSR
jgi:hypothetical protein